MNYSQAFEKLENEISKLEIANPVTGEIYPEPIARSIVARFHGTSWDNNVTDLFEDRITAEEYCDRQMALVSEYANHLGQLRVEKRIFGTSVTRRNSDPLRDDPELDARMSNYIRKHFVSVT